MARTDSSAAHERDPQHRSATARHLGRADTLLAQAFEQPVGLDFVLVEPKGDRKLRRPGVLNDEQVIHAELADLGRLSLGRLLAAEGRDMHPPGRDRATAALSQLEAGPGTGAAGLDLVELRGAHATEGDAARRCRGLGNRRGRCRLRGRLALRRGVRRRRRHKHRSRRRDSHRRRHGGSHLGDKTHPLGAKLIAQAFRLAGVCPATDPTLPDGQGKQVGKHQRDDDYT